MFPKFIAIEGADRVGKRTQVSLLCKKLQSYGYKVLVVEVPWNGSVTYDLTYAMLESGAAKRWPTIFQMVQWMNKISCQRSVLQRCHVYDYVIFDRWRLSMNIYGIATGANRHVTDVFHKYLICPDVTIILDGVGHCDIGEDEYERDTNLQRCVKELYSHRSRDFESNSVIVSIDDKSRIAINYEVLDTLRLVGVLNDCDDGVNDERKAVQVG